MVSVMERMYTSSESCFLLGPVQQLTCYLSFRVAFKSPATIAQGQATAKYDGEAGILAARGRHDPCVVPR